MRPRRASGVTREAEVVIAELGSAGDGVAWLEGMPVYVPFALPGERWRLSLAGARRHAWQVASSERQGGGIGAQPPCRHFGLCGGCSLQHLPPSAYGTLKRDRILRALAQAGVQADNVGDILVSPLGSRRRIRLAFTKRGQRTLLGYRRRRSNDIVDIEHCPIAEPSLVTLLEPLRRLLGALADVAGEGEVLLTATDAGVDIALTRPRSPDREDRERLAEAAVGLDLARIAIALPGTDEAEPVVVRRPPYVTFGSVRVEVPAGAFLQATREGEVALQHCVREWVPKGAHLVDLFAGLGTLSLPLLPGLASLRAFEADHAAVSGLTAALRRTGRGRAQASSRNLEREPLTVEELRRMGADHVLLDPPRTGARSQVEKLAFADLACIVYVSCNPATFARDARILAEGGWRLEQLQPVDQFLFSAEVELAARFRRGVDGA